MTFEERLQEALKAKGLVGKEIATKPVQESPVATTPEPPVQEVPVAETPVVSTPETPFPGMEVEELPVEATAAAPTETPFAGMEVEELPNGPVFDETTIITPELLSTLDYETIYDLTTPDSPLAPEQRDILANALRGSSDLADILSGYNESLGKEKVPNYDPFSTPPEEEVAVADAYLKNRDQSIAANVAVTEAVRKARLKYVADNPNVSDGIGSQLAGNFLGGTAAPRPEGAKSLPVPTKGRAFTDTAANSAMFGFADELIPESKNILTADASRDLLRKEEPTAALVAEIGGAVLSPSAGLQVLNATGKGLKAADTWWKTIGKVAAASGIDAGLTALGNDGDITTEALIGSVMGGGIATGSKAVQLGGITGKALVKLLTGTQTEIDTGRKVLSDLSKITYIDEARLEKSIKSSTNIMDALTKNGLSIEDAAKAVNILARQAPSNVIQTELRENAKGVVNNITGKSSDDVQDYLKSIDPKDIGEEIGMLYKSQSGSDIANITKRLMQTDSAPMYSENIRKAIADRAPTDTNILAGSGRSTVRADEIMIDKETGGIFIPNEGAVKLTKEQLKDTPNMFGYAKDDLFELTDGDNLRGDVFQSAGSKIAQKATFKEGEAPDQAFAEIISRVKGDLDSTVVNSVEGLGVANKAYSAKKAAKDTFELTNAFTKKQVIEPKDVDEYLTTVNQLAKYTDKDHKDAVLNGMKNFFGSNAKSSKLLTATGEMNPEFRKAMTKAGLSNSELDSFEQLAKDKTFFSEFLKSTGAKTINDDLLGEAASGFFARLFFQQAWSALKNTALYVAGKRAADGFDTTTASKNYSDLVKKIASMKESDYAKVQELVKQKGISHINAIFNLAIAKTATTAAKTYTAQ